MSSQIGAVRSIRVFVEPVEVELDDDQGVLWTSLQTAFPGCSGMYFRGTQTDCRRSVKFDGKKFQPPGGAWNDREYFVTLSQRCHSAQMPFGNYENASKQFERSVNTVQQMLAASLADGGRRRSKQSAHSSPPTETSSDTATSIRERESLLRSSGRPLSSIEQQFVDLAKISTGKDAIIDNQRNEIRKLTEKIEDMQKELAASKQSCSDLSSRINAQENELDMFRKLGEQQTYQNNKVRELTSTLSERDAELQSVKEELEETKSVLNRETNQMREKIATVSLQLNAKTEELEEKSEQLQLATVARDLMSREVDQLRPLAELIDLDNPECVESYAVAIQKSKDSENQCSKLQKELEEVKETHKKLLESHEERTRDCTTLQQRNEQLEKRMSHVDSELESINEEWKQRLSEKQEYFDKVRGEAETEVGSLKKELSSLQVLLETATRDATENARRLESVQHSKEEMKRAWEAAEFKQQEPLKRQIRVLTEDLKEAEDKVCELTGLVASLASDVRNNKRDIDDII